MLFYPFLLQVTAAATAQPPPTVPAWEASLLRWLPVVIAAAMPLLLIAINRRNAKKDKDEVAQEAKDLSEKNDRINRLHIAEGHLAELMAARQSTAQQLESLGDQQKRNTERIEAQREGLMEVKTQVSGIKESVNNTEANVRGVMQMLMQRQT